VHSIENCIGLGSERGYRTDSSVFRFNGGNAQDSAHFLHVVSNCIVPLFHSVGFSFKLFEASDQTRSMNWLAPGWTVFRYLADLSHFVSVGFLLYKMLSKRTCAGVSLQSQILYLIVFVTRYCNPSFFNPPIYNVIFKAFYIISAAVIVIVMKTTLAKTYDKRHDTFRSIFFILLAVILGFISKPYHTFWSFLFAFSLWLESVAIIPQMILLGRTTKLDVLTREYLFFLSIYRLLYVVNWLYKGITESAHTPWVVWITGVIQTLVFSDFIYIYIRMKITGAEFELPYSGSRQ
jgi:ER lumen protein retaining receptor